VKKGKIVLEYKYPGQPWKQFDWTAVPAWADEQEIRMKREHPSAEHRKREVK
jgi:hypothetical protein